MNYAQLRTMDVANGEGIRVSLFASGCTHNCKGCFNKDYQDFNYGQPMNVAISKQIINLLKKRHYKGLTLLGGEPFQNLELVEYITPIREFIDDYNLNITKSFNKKDIWIYSGYRFEEIYSNKKMLALLTLCDVLIDGLFVEELLDLRLKFRGSSNQRILDVQKSIQEQKAINYYQKE